MNSKICTACAEEKPLSLFVAGRTYCKSCGWAARDNYHADKLDRERHQRQVLLNRLINSIPRVMA